MKTVPDICKVVIKKLQLINKGDKFVITGGVPMGVPGTTNYVSVQTF